LGAPKSSASLKTVHSPELHPPGLTWCISGMLVYHIKIVLSSLMNLLHSPSFVFRLLFNFKTTSNACIVAADVSLHNIQQTDVIVIIPLLRKRPT
jgi:hypothetical protein